MRRTRVVFESFSNSPLPADCHSGLTVRTNDINGKRDGPAEAKPSR